MPRPGRVPGRSRQRPAGGQRPRAGTAGREAARQGAQRGNDRMYVASDQFLYCIGHTK